MKHVLFLTKVDWSNVSTVLCQGINTYSKNYHADVVCLQENPFKYTLQHDINLSQTPDKQTIVIELINNADIIIYCEELQKTLLLTLIPNFISLIANKKILVYSASYCIDPNKHDMLFPLTKYSLQLYVPEIYYSGTVNQRKFVIPGCPVVIPSDVEQIFTNKGERIVISHICSRSGRAGKIRKGSDIIARLVRRIQQKHPNVDFNNIPYTERSNDEILYIMAQSDIYIDQYNPRIGGFGTSSIEAILQGCIVLASLHRIPPSFYELFSTDGYFPIINISTPKNMIRELDSLCSMTKDQLHSIAKRNIVWMRDNMRQKYIQYYENEILNHYT